jgi:hypothetical protein
MEPRKIEMPVQPHNEGQTSPPRQSEVRKRRFQIVKLEERIAPGGSRSDITCRALGCPSAKPGHCK